jgi:hypothetical protein
MFKRSTFASLALSFAFFGSVALDSGCKKDDTVTPGDDEELAASPNAGGGGSSSSDDSDDGDSLYDDDGSDFDGVNEADPDTESTEEKLKKPEPKEVCKGKKKKRVCKMVDPDPGISAQIGVNAITKGYSWGMTPDQVLGELSKKIEAEYDAKQKKAKDPMSQDRNREWRKEQLEELRRGNVQFKSNANQKWNVSLIQYEFEDDAQEEMVWIRSGRYLRKFFFFKDNGLWKIVYAYQTEKWGKEYDQVVEETFKKWFGISPEAKVKQDPKTAAPLMTYNEWTSKNGEKIRSFDLSAVHGVYMITVLDGNIEQQIGERLPNVKEEEGFSTDVGDVLGGSDVEYDADGNIITTDRSDEDDE